MTTIQSELSSPDGSGQTIKTHCSKGHPLNADNLYGYRGRQCKTCRRLRHREYMRSVDKSKYLNGSMDEETAGRVMAALRSGRTINSICNGRIDGRRTKSERITYLHLYRNYCAQHPDFALEAGILQTKNAQAANARKGSLKREMTHCIHGHPLSGVNLLVEGRTGFRRCRICLARRAASPRPPTEEQIKRVTAALNAGQTIARICWGIVDGKRSVDRIIGHNKLKLYREMNPDFDKFVGTVTAGSGSRAQQRRHNPKLFQAEVLRSERNDYHAITNLLPANLPYDVRNDIVQSIFMALLEGSLRRDQVRSRVQQFITAHNREANKHGVGQYGLRSLDAPLYADSSRTLGDTLEHGFWQ